MGWCRNVRLRSHIIILIITTSIVFLILKFKSIYYQISQTENSIETLIENIHNASNQLTTLIPSKIQSKSSAITTTTTTTTPKASTVKEMELIPKALFIDLPNMFPWRHCLQVSCDRSIFSSYLISLVNILNTFISLVNVLNIGSFYLTICYFS